MKNALNGKEHIITITSGGLLYRDATGLVCWLDFRECRDAWLANQDNPSALEWRYVGTRSPRHTSQSTIIFFGAEKRCFRFKHDVERQILCIVPLSRFGWYTILP